MPQSLPPMPPPLTHPVSQKPPHPQDPFHPLYPPPPGLLLSQFCLRGTLAVFQSCLPFGLETPPGQGAVSLSLHPLYPAWYREGAECPFAGWVSETVAGGSGSWHTGTSRHSPAHHRHHSQSHQHDGSAQTTTGVPKKELMLSKYPPPSREV